jgi:hypothetical protein
MRKGFGYAGKVAAVDGVDKQEQEMDALQPAQLPANKPSWHAFNQSVSPLASGASAGEFFQYTVADVSLPRQKSAMIPIVTDSLKVSRLSIYNAGTLPDHPLLGARLTNTTGKLCNSLVPAQATRRRYYPGVRRAH